MTTDTMERRGSAPAPQADLRASTATLRRRIRWITVGLALVWTLLWAVPGVEALLTETALGSGSYGRSVETFEVFEILFVGAYYASRMIPGAALILVAGLLAGRWLERRATAARA